MPEATCSRYYYENMHTHRLLACSSNILSSDHSLSFRLELLYLFGYVIDTEDVSLEGTHLYYYVLGVFEDELTSSGGVPKLQHNQNVSSNPRLTLVVATE